jgi:hypothetical protein
MIAQAKKKAPERCSRAFGYERGIDLRSDTLLLFFLRFPRASCRLLFGDASQFALRHKPALAAHVGQQSALDHLAAEATEQLLLRFIRS